MILKKVKGKKKKKKKTQISLKQYEKLTEIQKHFKLTALCVSFKKLTKRATF